MLTITQQRHSLTVTENRIIQAKLKVSEARDLINYARERGIRVVPEFDMPGHSTAWFVGYPELASAPGPYEIERRWGIFDPAMDPTNEKTYKFLDELIAEGVDAELVDLLDRMLQKNPAERIAFEEICLHPWYWRYHPHHECRRCHPWFWPCHDHAGHHGAVSERDDHRVDWPFRIRQDDVLAFA